LSTKTENDMAKVRTKAKSKATTKPEKSEGLDLSKLPAPVEKSTGIGALPKGWAKADDVLDRVRAVPTRFVDFNRGTRVGGLPVRRIHTVHGPTHGGKTAFVGGLVESFVSAGHIGAYVDAEHATPNEFFEELFRKPLRDVPNFLADRPKSYEETIDKVDTFLRWVAEEKKNAPDLASILVVDSINKLVPERELEKLRKEGADAIDKGWGRYRAAMNQAWLDHLTPMLAAADCALVIIAQERDEQAEGFGYQEEFKVKGGAALLFDASMVMRVSKGTAIKEGDGKDAKIYGFRHRVRIWKSKVAHMDGRYTDVAFHLSNGSLTPAGFDVARDLLHVGRAVGVVETSGSWLSFAKRRWQGEQRAILGIAEDLDTQAALRLAIDSKIRKVA